MDKIIPMAIMKNLFVISCFIVYFFKKVYTTKKAPTEVSAIFVKLISAVDCTFDKTTFQSSCPSCVEAIP